MISKKALARVAAAALSVVCLVSCTGNGSFTGKGHLPSSTGDGRAALTFKVICPLGSDTISGAVRFKDNAAHVLMLGRATEVASDGDAPITCDGSRNQAHYVGSYTSPFGAPGTFTMDILMNAKGCSGPGTVTIKATSGVHDGYSNTGCFKGSLRPVGHVDLSDI